MPELLKQEPLPAPLPAVQKAPLPAVLPAPPLIDPLYAIRIKQGLDLYALRIASATSAGVRTDIRIWNVHTLTMATSDSDLNLKRTFSTGAHSDLQVSFWDIMSPQDHVSIGSRLAPRQSSSLDPTLVVADMDMTPANDNDPLDSGLDEIPAPDPAAKARAIKAAMDAFDMLYKFGIDLPANDN